MKQLLNTIIIILMLGTFSCETNRYINDQTDVITIDSTKINRKALIIGIDGFRSDAMQESITPFIYNLTENKNTYYNPSHIVEEITYSGPNWSSILTGVHMTKHNVTNNEYDNYNYDDYPPFFFYIEKAISEKKTASIVNWMPINTYTLSNYVDEYNLDSMNDSTVFEETKSILSNSSSTDGNVIFIQFDELDVAGHSHEFSPNNEEYINTAGKIDNYAQELFNIIEQKRQNKEDWIFIIVSDHGGEGTEHGDANNPNINTTIFLTEHPFIEFRGNCCYISSQVDIAPSILHFLGISSSQFDRKTDGNSILL